MKYLICFRGADHQHDALTGGIEARKKGKIKYDGGIKTKTAVPMSPVLGVAATFPNSGDLEKEDSVTTIDVLLIPLPEPKDQNDHDEILASRLNQSGNIIKKSEHSFVSTSTVQKLDSINALRSAKLSKQQEGQEKSAQRDENLDSSKSEIDAMEEEEDKIEMAYDTLSGMVWSHEVAVKSVSAENVVATMKCQRKDGYFTISDIEWQKDDIVNPDFVTEGYKDKLEAYLKEYDGKPHLLLNEESHAYRGYVVREEDENGEEIIKDYSDIHKDGRYQIYLDEIQRLCDNNKEGKINFTHEDNLKLIRKCIESEFKIEINEFFKELKEQKEKAAAPIDETKHSKSLQSTSVIKEQLDPKTSGWQVTRPTSMNQQKSLDLHRNRPQLPDQTMEKKVDSAINEEIKQPEEQSLQKKEEEQQQQQQKAVWQKSKKPPIEEKQRLNFFNKAGGAKDTKSANDKIFSHHNHLKRES